MEFARRIVKPLFWAALVFAYVMAILPAASAPQVSQSDKVDHILAFMTLAVLGKLAYPKVRALALAALLAGFGAAIEFTQMVPSIHRDGELADWIADCAAIAGGLAFVALVVRDRRSPTG